MGCVMRNSESLIVQYEISEEAKALSEKLGYKWDLEPRDPFDNIFHLRAVIKDDIGINPNELIPINTGIYLQVTEPNYQILVTPYMNTLRRKNIGIIANRFDKGYTNEIKLLMYNYSSEIKVLNPGEIIGLLSIAPVTEITTHKVFQINKNKDRKKDNNWVQEDKRVSEKEKTLKENQLNSEPLPYNETLVNNIIKDRLK